MNHNEIFKKDFLKISPVEITNKIKSSGFFYYESALSEKFINSITERFSSSDLALNINYLSGIHTKTQYFNTNILAISKSFYELCTSKFILKICNLFLQSSDFRLKAVRYYETYKNNEMQWHTDTKTSKEFSEIEGLIFIIYITDVNDGEFQYIEGSHTDSKDFKKNDFTLKEISKLYSAKNIISFKGKRGSIIIYNTAGIHRANPNMRNNKYPRKSLFFQVDRSNNSESFVINPSFIKTSEKEIFHYLGFGEKNSYDIFPNTSIMDLPLKKFISKVIIPWLFGQPKTLLRKFLSNDLKLKLKLFLKNKIKK